MYEAIDNFLNGAVMGIVCASLLILTTTVIKIKDLLEESARMIDLPRMIDLLRQRVIMGQEIGEYYFFHMNYSEWKKHYGTKVQNPERRSAA